MGSETQGERSWEFGTASSYQTGCRNDSLGIGRGHLAAKVALARGLFCTRGRGQPSLVGIDLALGVGVRP